MKRSATSVFLGLVSLFCTWGAYAQSPLSLEKIMQGEKFIGFLPEELQWSPSGNNLYFTWTENVDSIPSLYVLKAGAVKPLKMSLDGKKKFSSSNGTYDRRRSRMVCSMNGDIYLIETGTGKTRQITLTMAQERDPVFSQKEDKIIFTSGNNLFSWDIALGTFEQLTDFRSGKEQGQEPLYANAQDKWVHDNQLYLFNTLAEKKKKATITSKEENELEPKKPKTIYTGSDQVRSAKLSPDGNYLTWQSFQSGERKRTIVPNYVTESGYTEDIPARPKAGQPFFTSGDLNIYDLIHDTIYRVRKENIPGIDDSPEYLSDYPARKAEKTESRGVAVSDPVWSDDGYHAVVEIYALDNKDRWIMLLNISNGELKLLDRQHDSAWINRGEMRSSSIVWLTDNKTIFFMSEESGYSHLYSLDINSGQKTDLTPGRFEIYDLKLSNDKKRWYFISNESDPGVRELCSMPVNGGLRMRLTSFQGGVEYELSPDEKYFALRVSHSNEPWELYTLENKSKAVPVRITESTTGEFRSYNWRIPEIIRFKASDGAMVPARLYKPDISVKNGPAVIFVHGAGYLQNAHRWWSYYSHEYMFHNFLVAHGYTVLDIDYRGSAGYGRDWRTAIYRNMGGRDLDDQTDGARYLEEQCHVDPQRIGIYGGSYGGFITLMAMFRKPGIFKAGAALRPVTDWAHYNNGYTSEILNTPVTDSLAYARSSPIYYADGLKGSLLICHGMIDDNVHFQDVVRLAQKLIELGKNNWELAVYPVESHSFTEASSWTDEYKRIFKLFEEQLKK